MLEDGADASYSLIASHHGPHLRQLNTFDMFHDDVFTLDRVEDIIVPIEDFGDGNLGLGLYWTSCQPSASKSSRDIL